MISLPSTDAALPDDDSWLRSTIARLFDEHCAKAIAAARFGKVVDLRAYRLAAVAKSGLEFPNVGLSVGSAS